MAYRSEKVETGYDIVIDGFENGIAPSPHKGMANIQGGNISTENGEVLASFVRAKNNPQGALSGQTLTVNTGTSSTLAAAPSTLYGGQWITVTAATANIYASDAPLDYLVVAGGGAGGASENSGGNPTGGGGGAGGMLTGTLSAVTTGAYTITVGTGGTGGAGDGGNGGNSSLAALAVATGGGGGGKGADAGQSGGSGGGGGANGAGVGTAGTGTVGQGNDGAAGNNSGGTAFYLGGGGGGATSAASGGNGGAGTASSITGSSVTYAGGGGGGANGGSTGGAGGGGAGGSGAGTAGTANTGGGGGGSRYDGSNHNGADGGAGVVIVRYLTANMTATGGTITTSGSYTVHTFTTSGTFTVTAITRQITLPTGDYFVSYKDSNNNVQISSHYDPYSNHPTVFVASGTITFNLTKVFGNPISKATETYRDATQTQYRYYILDALGQVWVYDTAVYAYSLANWGVGVTWSLPDETVYGSPANSIAVLNGWLLWLNNVQIYGKPTVNLGQQFTALDNAYMNNPFPTHTNYALVGHQGRAYWCDGNYIGSLFPDTSVVTGVANIQSYSQYTASTITGTVSELLSGSNPYITDNSGNRTRIPAVFFTDQYGTQPSNLTANTIYYIDMDSVGSASFSVYAAITGGSQINIQTGAAGNQYFNTFWPVGSDSGIYATHSTVTFSQQRLNLPSYETAQFLCEIGNTVLVGCKGNVVYPWNQVSTLPGGIINLPESNVISMVTVNQMGYIFTGNKGNIYITDGSTASLVIKVPDYCAGIPGSPATYVEPSFTWGDSAYIRGRVYFSILDQTSTKTGNCGGIWSFVTTQNLYIGQDIGLALRLENQNSYNTYNGLASLIIQNQVQNTGAPLFWSAWYSDITTPTYGIDYSTQGTDANFPVVIETDAIPTGTLFQKKTFQQIEFKLSSPLDSSATVAISYRKDITSAYTSLGTAAIEQNRLAAIFKANFQNTQWLQLKVTLTPITSTASTNTFVRLKQIRLR
ncbi:MAG: hypothetical protein KGL39_34635 [Patescibacteria group bacterium]|nr:hypothetical protein [Patescibacteria group bacterium]